VATNEPCAEDQRPECRCISTLARGPGGYALTEGALRADILTDATNAYPSKDKDRLYVFIHLIVRSSGQFAVKLTDFRLVDELRRE